jgi:general stress protein 26
MKDLVEARRACLGVMTESEAVYVTTLDGDGAPVTRAMFNLRRRAQFPGLQSLFTAHDEDLLVHLSTNTSSAKRAQIARDPRVSLYYCILQTFHGVMLGGRIDINEDATLKEALWQEGWEIYFPQGLQDPDYTILSLRPARIRGWLGDTSFDLRVEQEP